MRTAASLDRIAATASLDLMIAATAYANGAGVFTRNSADFAGLEIMVPVRER